MIVALTPSPALDRTVKLAGSLLPGGLNRVGVAHEVAGGKGMNVVRAVTRLGGRAIGAVPLAGENGRTFAARAAAEGIPIVSAPTMGETRCCTIIVQDEPAHPTEINEPGARVHEDGWRELSCAISQLEPQWLAVCGTLPPETKPETLLSILAEATSGDRLAVDGGGATLAAAVRSGVRLISPNLSELAQLCHVLGWTERGNHAAARIYNEYGVEVLLSDGANGAGLFGPETLWASPHVPVSGNPIGSGDTLLGAYLSQLSSQDGATPLETRSAALKHAVAAAAANVAVGGGVRIDPQAVEQQLHNVTVERL